MKNHSLLINLIIFFLVLFFFVIPPAFFPSKAVETISFPITNLVLFLFSIFLFYFTSRKEKDFKNPKKNKGRLFKLILNAALCFASLFALGMIFNFLSFQFSQKKAGICLPETKKEFFYITLSFLFSAFYEEILYRLYIPEQIKTFFHGTKKYITVFLISEIPSLLFFALAHKYNGIFAVLNAGFAYIILRFFYKKTDNIFVNVASHFFYNLMMLFLSLI